MTETLDVWKVQVNGPEPKWCMTCVCAQDNPSTRGRVSTQRRWFRRVSLPLTPWTALPVVRKSLSSLQPVCPTTRSVFVWPPVSPSVWLSVCPPVLCLNLSICLIAILSLSVSVRLSDFVLHYLSMICFLFGYVRLSCYFQTCAFWALFVFLGSIRLIIKQSCLCFSMLLVYWLLV